MNRNMKWTIASGIGLGFLIAGAYAAFLQNTGNFHMVVENELYRSAQPSVQDIAAYKSAYGIQTIINLRGQNPGSPWYDNEVEESRKLGINHIDFRMSDKRELSEKDAEALVALFESSAKPILIHCKAGSDRSGLAAALYLASVSKDSEEAAEAQLSFRYGHLALPYFSRAFSMDESFEELEPWLGYERE